MELANTQIKIIRNEKIDICKGIGILLVVLGHTCYFHYFHKLVYCFHMPLFFLLSGYCIKKKYTILDFIKKRFKSLILPFFYFAVIEILMTTSIKRQFLWEYFYPNIGHTLWFLPVLFISITIVYSLILLNDKIILLSVLFLFFQGGIITNAISQLPYSMKSIIFASIFTGGGYLLSKIVIQFPIKIMALISFILTVIYILTASFWDIMVDMKQSLFTPWHLSILVATVGTLSIICLSTAIDFPNHIKRAFIWLGKNSLTIMLIHFIYITVFGYGLQLFFSLNTFYYGLAINVIIWPIIYISVMIINKYIPWIISKKKEQHDKN